MRTLGSNGRFVCIEKQIIHPYSGAYLNGLKIEVVTPSSMLVLDSSMIATHEAAQLNRESIGRCAIDQ